MTREEAIKMLKSKMDGHTDISYEWAETVRMAIKALEQEPCDKYIKEIDHLRKYIYKLETQIVEQGPRKGQWISSNGVPYTYFNSFTICSKCNKHPKEKSDFCPNCGADMREVDDGNND